jgi:AcrR family transcriptional regulator
VEVEPRSGNIRNIVPIVKGATVSGLKEGQGDGSASRGPAGRRPRADARRNIDALLEAAKAVFVASGVDASVREVAEKAGVGIGTIYRHFPRRSDLIVAVFRREVDACADAAADLAAEHEPGEALARWIQRYVEFISAKRGLAAALHSGNRA